MNKLFLPQRPKHLDTTLKMLTIGLALLSSIGQAAVITHTDREDWGAAVGSHLTEDFNAFTSDVSFHNNQVDLAHGLSILTTGSPLSGGGRNLIDTAPFGFGRNLDGTTDIQPDVNADSVFTIFFDGLTTGFGADVRYLDQGTTINLYNGVSLLSSFASLGAGGSMQQFIGFELTAGDMLDRIELVRLNVASGANNDNIVMDNFSVVPGQVAVPEADTISLLGLGMLLLLLRRREWASKL